MSLIYVMTMAMSRIDLNLLVMFDAIMRERSITAAAQQLAMTQPALSNAVARMRHHWGDPLFIKAGRGITPTPYAVVLWQQVTPALAQIEEAVAPQPFVPATARRCFRVGLTDGITLLVWPALRAIFEQHAPGIDLHAVPYRTNGEALLMAADVDLVFDYIPVNNPQIKHEWVFDNQFVVVMPPQHPLAAKTQLSFEEFVQAEHLLVSLSGEARGFVDVALERLGSRRRIAMTVNSLTLALQFIQQMSLLCVLPYSVVAQAIQAGDLVMRMPPLQVPAASISLAWHSRDERDQGLKWLRQQIKLVVAQQQHLLHLPTLPNRNDVE